MKKVLLVGVLLLSSCYLFAAPVDVNIASKVAANFYASVSDVSDVKLAFSMNFPKSTTPSLYVFDMGNGYVVTSADNRIVPVLAFSTEGGFDAGNIPAGLLYMLEEYQREMGAVFTSEKIDSATTQQQWSDLLAAPKNSRKNEVVAPLIQSLWSQDAPYNSLCPSANGVRAKVGCGAMVMGQIMHYWSYPSSGIGSNGYTCNYGSYGYGDYGYISADFESVTYRYALMLDRLYQDSPSFQVNAVATLLYHCGIAANMVYGPTASVANSSNMIDAMITHFGYPEQISYCLRSDYSETTFLNGIRGELNDSAPFFYGASGSYGGHVFICDGYRDDDYFHLNWGWGGNYNGYYLLSALNPGPYDFNSSHAVIVGIRRPEEPPVGIDESPKEHTMTLYPNPTKGRVWVDGLQKSGESDLLELDDLQGRCIGWYEPGQIDLSDLPAGIYVLRAGREHLKVIKQ